MRVRTSASVVRPVSARIIPDHGAWSRRVASLAAEMGRAYWVAYRVVRDASAAEEAVQEAYTSMLQHPPEDFGHEQILTYFFKRVHGSAADLAKTSRNRKRRERKHAVHSDSERMAPMPDEALASAETARLVRDAIGELPQKEREAVSVCFELGFSQQMAADILDVSRETISYRVHCGLAKLRKILTAQGVCVATPLALVGMIQGLGVPPPSAGLQTAVTQLLRNPSPGTPVRRSSRRSRRASRSTGSAPPSTVQLFLAGGVVAAVAFTNLPDAGMRPPQAAAPAPTWTASAPPAVRVAGGHAEPVVEVRKAPPAPAFRAGKILITCDNQYELFCDGTRVGSGTDWQKTQTYAWNFRVGRNVVAVAGRNVGAVAALLAEIQCGTLRLGSGAHWKGSPVAPPDWHTPEFDDSAWPNAVAYGRHDVGAPWNGLTGFPKDSRAEWIWSASNTFGTDDRLYLRLVFTLEDDDSAKR